MKRLVLATLLALAACVLVSDAAQAGNPAGYPFYPFGFYQPYGARYSSSINAPPHFAVNPPVYYGARYARPYGISPFASPPVVSAPSGYEGRLRSTFHEPVRETPQPVCNPYLSQTQASPSRVAQVGPVRENPFASTTDNVVKN